LIPDPATRFQRTARRLEVLAAGHPMAEWLTFLAALSQAQHAAALVLGTQPVDAVWTGSAVASGQPPLAASGPRPDGAWRDALGCILDRFTGQAGLPAAVASVVAALRASSAPDLERLAEAFLGGSLGSGQAGPALFVAAALQVALTRLAGGIAPSALALLADRAACPCCGSPPVAGVVTASGGTPGVRYLYCSLCSTAWNHVRAVCITCGQSGTLVLRGLENSGAAIRAETCDDCGTYAKVLYRDQAPDLDPFADDLASLGLDIMVAEAGWARHAPNPWLMASQY
jgi:FdhE protein